MGDSERVIFDFDPRTLPRSLLAAIGRVVASSSQTESIIEGAIAGCLGLDVEFGWAVTTHMAAPLRFDVLRAAAEIRIHDLSALDELDIILDAVKSASDERNLIVHSSWYIDPRDGRPHMMRQTARASVKVDARPRSAEEIEAVAKAVYDSGMRLWLFMDKHGLIPPPPPPRPRGHKSRAERKKRRRSQAEERTERA